ncbi:NAD-dependent epimerase/dehydratase family protein [Candidatus Nanohalovita haloferacivicina]|uniref:NAD-dependent epimerase/dehydratase family protein n=1 Tax=Candidatus Nanohalovita haloferacivicina TaxID=2978046 RepID=UPI00325F9B12|nr:UDP-glucose 4-epimerase [Candidatus Nanohalobia archaeon BNXNv]
MKIGITGGAGFIGSTLAEELKDEHEVLVIDNFSSGREENVPEGVEVLEFDIKDEGLEEFLEDVDTVFHFAANPKVNTFPDDREKDFDENFVGTKNVLDACVNADIDDVIFASSSVVYGEEAEIPTPEDHRLDPISMYGATKAGDEHMVQVYGQTFGIDTTIVRLANIIGGKNPKGVIYDFVHKLDENPEELTILGNGKQRKSYIYIEDTVNGILKAWESDKSVFNIGSEDSIDVDSIAEIVADEMGLDPEFSYTGGDRGWTGDVPEMRLSIEKLKSEGWRPSRNSAESVRKTAREVIENL